MNMLSRLNLAYAVKRHKVKLRAKIVFIVFEVLKTLLSLVISTSILKDVRSVHNRVLIFYGGKIRISNHENCEYS
jgi:hypothetical protein